MINALFIFIPLAVILERVMPEAHTWIFFAAAVAIIPIARLIVESTEHIAAKTGDAIGGLLNATFGNAPELIIAVVALKAGLFDMVRASLIGAILANLLLALGIGFLLGGLRYHNQEYNAGATRFATSAKSIATGATCCSTASAETTTPSATATAETGTSC